MLERLGRSSEAIENCGQVLEQITAKGQAERRTHYAAVSNLANALRSSGSATSCWLALEYVGGAKKLSPRPCAPLYHLEWIEGLIWAKLLSLGVRTGYCLTEEAENALRRAFSGFVTLRLPWEIALVGLDLTQLYRDLERWPAVLEIAIETRSRFQSLDGDGRAAAALGRIVVAAQARQGVVAAIRDTREIARPGMKPSKLTRARADVPPPPLPAARSTPTLALVETRRRLLAAAYKEIPHGFQMKRIALAGSNDTLYKHFGDRAGLAVAVVDEHMRGLVTAWVACLGHREPLADVAGLEPPLLMPPAREYRELVREPLECVYRDWQAALAEKLERGQQERTVRADIDPASAAGLLLTALRSPEPRDPQALRTACAALAEAPGNPGADVSRENRACRSLARRHPRRVIHAP